MSGLLASVRSVREASTALLAQADIIDCKEPDHGALGALGPEEIIRIVREVDGRRPVSATTGDIYGNLDALRQAIHATADCGVDLIKFGIFESAEGAALIEGLVPLAENHDLIAVCFADRYNPMALLPLLAQGGYRGVMIDTADKNAGSLTRIWSGPQLENFVQQARRMGLLCGLAGSLRVNDIPTLLPLQSDYLGFRGALCGGDRRQGLDQAACLSVRNAIPFGRKVSVIHDPVQVMH